MTSHYIQPLDECRHNCHHQANVTLSLRFQVLQIQHRMCHYEVLISEVRVQVSGAIFQEMQAAFEKFYRIPLPEAVIQRALKPRSEHLSPPITRAPSLLSSGINNFHHNSNELILLIKIWYKWRGSIDFEMSWTWISNFKTNLKSSSEIAGKKVSVNIPPVHNLRHRYTMADGDNNHPQPLWTGFRRFFDPPQKTDGFRTCIILNPYGFGTDSPLHVNDDNPPQCFLLANFKTTNCVP